jgi:hypothetical protein
MRKQNRHLHCTKFLHGEKATIDCGLRNMETILHGIAAVVVKNANVERRIVSKFFQRTRITNVMMMMNLFMEHQALGVFVESNGSNFFFFFKKKMLTFSSLLLPAKII